MSKTILLADDSLTIQKVVELTFSDTDFDVVSTSSGDELLEKLAPTAPDLIICDTIMPGTDGYQVCQKVKSDPDALHIPVILLTGTFEPFDRDRALAAGCSEIITKPFEARKLVETVERLAAGEILIPSSPEAAAGSIPPPIPTGEGAEPPPAEAAAEFGTVLSPAVEEAAAAVAEEAAAVVPEEAPPEDGLDFTSTGFAEMEAAGQEEGFTPAHTDDGLDFTYGIDSEATPSDHQAEAPAAIPEEKSHEEPENDGSTQPLPQDDFGAAIDEIHAAAHPEADVQSIVSEAPEETAEESFSAPPADDDNDDTHVLPTVVDAPVEAEKRDGVTTADADRWEGETEDRMYNAEAAEVEAPAAEVYESEPPAAEAERSEPEAYEAETPTPEPESYEPVIQEDDTPEAETYEPETYEADTSDADTSPVMDPVPGKPPVAEDQAQGGLSEADVDRIARRVVELASDRLEQIAWEVVPDMAEIVVRERVREIEADIDGTTDSPEAN